MLRVIFKFVGGPLDGSTVAGYAEQPGEEAHKYYALSNHGRLGQRFRVASEYTVNTLVDEELREEKPHRFQPHVYEVVDRIDNGEVLIVRAEYVKGPVRAKR